MSNSIKPCIYFFIFLSLQSLKIFALFHDERTSKILQRVLKVKNTSSCENAFQMLCYNSIKLNKQTNKKRYDPCF